MCEVLLIIGMLLLAMESVDLMNRTITSLNAVNSRNGVRNRMETTIESVGYFLEAAVLFEEITFMTVPESGSMLRGEMCS